MTIKKLREKFFKFTKDGEEFTLGKTCVDFFGICNLFKILFVLFITYRMFYFDHYKKFFFLIFSLAFVNITFNYIVYNRFLNIKLRKKSE